ncbi:MAG: flippase-like domain-containing protein [Chloroflexi bacterium]|nr:flippase-like domain-containing protein [Chloroflexota bacterium]
MSASALNGLKRKLLASLALGLIVILAVVVFGDVPKISQALGRFEWKYIPAILGLTLANYLLRFGKWQFYLRLVGVGRISKKESFFIFFSGLSMVMTPGKVGEWLKSFLLRESTGTPFAASAPIIIAERLSDGLAMILLASGGLILYGQGWQILLLFLAGCLGLVAISQNRALVEKLLSAGERVTLLSKRIHHVRMFYESSYQLLRYRNLALATVIGFVSWAGECVAFYLVLIGLGIPASPILLVQAAFVLAASTLIGSISMLPGGLAVAEGSITGLLLLLGVTAEASLAATATLLIRFCTLWFGVAVGIVALFLYSRQTLGKASEIVSPEAS